MSVIKYENKLNTLKPLISSKLEHSLPIFDAAHVFFPYSCCFFSKVTNILNFMFVSVLLLMSFIKMVSLTLNFSDLLQSKPLYFWNLSILLNALKVHPFLVLYNIPFCNCYQIYVFIYLSIHDPCDMCIIVS